MKARGVGGSAVIRARIPRSIGSVGVAHHVVAMAAASASEQLYAHSAWHWLRQVPEVSLYSTPSMRRVDTLGGSGQASAQPPWQARRHTRSSSIAFVTVVSQTCNTRVDQRRLHACERAD